MTAVCGLVLLAAGCAPPDNREADSAAIRAADIAWSAVTEKGDVDGHMSYYADGAVILPPNQAMMTDRNAMRQMIADMFAMPGAVLKWMPTTAEAAKSGDIGYSIGTYEFSFTGPDGSPMTDKGKYTTVWKKQTDGSWKVAVDMFSSEQEAGNRKQEAGSRHERTLRDDRSQPSHWDEPRPLKTDGMPEVR
jgi:ketosteroid isomerase-like protein